MGNLEYYFRHFLIYPLLRAFHKTTKVIYCLQFFFVHLTLRSVILSAHHAYLGNTLHTSSYRLVHYSTVQHCRIVHLQCLTVQCTMHFTMQKPYNAVYSTVQSLNFNALQCQGSADRSMYHSSEEPASQGNWEH